MNFRLGSSPEHRRRNGAAFMTAIQYLDQPPAGWFVLDVMRQEDRGRDWVALMVDIHPDELKKLHL